MQCDKEESQGTIVAAMGRRGWPEVGAWRRKNSRLKDTLEERERETKIVGWDQAVWADRESMSKNEPTIIEDPPDRCIETTMGHEIGETIREAPSA